MGVDVGGSKVLGVALDRAGRVMADLRVPTPSEGPAVVEAVMGVALAMSASEDGRPESARPNAPSAPPPLGVGAPGMVDRPGRVHFSPNLTCAEGLYLKAELSRKLPGVALVVENDATCACAAEQAMGAARGAEDVLMVTLGTGIGGGIMSGGRLLVGSHGFAGEIGHMVVDSQGPECPCGQRGCWERFASGSGLARMGRQAVLEGTAPVLGRIAGSSGEVRGEHVTAAAVAGDPGAAEVLDRFARWLGLGLANLANVLDPQVIVLGGGLIEAGDVLLEPTRAALLKLVEAGHLRPEIPLLPAALGERAGAIGAALLAGRY